MGTCNGFLILHLILVMGITLPGCSLPLPPKPLASPSWPRKIALLHMHDRVSFFARLGNLTEHNKRRYAERHGYDFVLSTPQHTSGIYKQLDCNVSQDLVQSGPDALGKCWGADRDFDIDHSRAPTFGKIKLALSACKGRDDAWLLWTDADAIVINQSVPLESIIDDGYDIMLAYDWLMLNAGMLLIKCSDWSKQFLNSVYNARQFDTARALDQSSFQQHIDNLTKSEADEHIKVVPKYAINVYLEEYRPGDFLVHMAGKLYEATEAGLFAIANQLDILSMVDDKEDIKAFFRSPALLNYYSGLCPVKYGEKQHSCKQDDPRRIFLNETLGSMSYPNRYRHVGLRYYWLGDWKDKYDVSGWNTKRKPFPMQHRNERIQPAPPSFSMNGDAVANGSEGLSIPSNEKQAVEQRLQNAPEEKIQSDDTDHMMKNEDLFEIGHDDNTQVFRPEKPIKDHRDEGLATSNRGFRRPIHVWALAVIVVAFIVRMVIVFRKRKKTSKTH